MVRMRRIAIYKRWHGPQGAQLIVNSHVTKSELTSFIMSASEASGVGPSTDEPAAHLRTEGGDNVGTSRATQDPGPIVPLATLEMLVGNLVKMALEAQETSLATSTPSSGEQNSVMVRPLIR